MKHIEFLTKDEDINILELYGFDYRSYLPNACTHSGKYSGYVRELDLDDFGFDNVDEFYVCLIDEDGHPAVNLSVATGELSWEKNYKLPYKSFYELTKAGEAAIELINDTINDFIGKDEQFFKRGN